MSEKTNFNNMDERMKPFAVKATAKSVRRRNVLLKLFIIILLIIILLLGAFYALSTFVNKAGNFTVWIPDEQYNLITLSDTPDFVECSAMLEADVIPQMDNITKAWMPENLDEVDGCHNGDNYIAYTFYLKNAGENKSVTVKVTVTRNGKTVATKSRSYSLN